MSWIASFFVCSACFFASWAHGMEVYGHRGAAIAAPENTLDAIEEAFRRGYEGVEFDIQLTGDGTLILLHDDTLERTARFDGALEGDVFQRIVTTPVGALEYDTGEALSRLNGETLVTYHPQDCLIPFAASAASQSPGQILELGREVTGAGTHFSTLNGHNTFDGRDASVVVADFLSR